MDSKALNNSEIDFDDAIPILEDDLLSGSIDKPLNPTELVVLELNNTKMDATKTAYFLLVRAVDEAKNVSDMKRKSGFE